ncbi:SWIM zinc finger family protein [Polyangium sorediatum]|uniref:SWIM zinc finger domain-containing protein n=1 Tax=Polyangium sorediatum TaxID=889274 RepID=A0ABT6P639_9BACT|nr:SWIM zinc finger family protein [Polyangium sorediatum]MDI1436006.1 SWIM zinc finger domain-containing protein [Polyangium sorediatum]
MNVDLRYLGKSGVLGAAQSLLVRFSPNLARPKTFFDAELKDAIRFREAMSALHDVVVGDLKFRKKDKTAYQAWKKAEEEREAQLKAQLFDQAKRAELARLAKEPIPPNLDRDFRKMHRLYWDARVKWANELARHDPELFRHLVPCDPVVTVAPDVVFFECFSKDESSYGCLSVDRDSFVGAQEAGLGTTNVDYSIALYEHFQTLRSYRKTRLSVDPTGFDVKVEGVADYREEKIDLPPSWLRGFGQIQASTCLPSRRVDLPVEVVYAILAHLKRHREKTGPRSIRFVLTPGKAPKIILDPWGIEIQSRGPVYDGGLEIGGSSVGGKLGPYRSAPAGREITEEVKIWGRRRLFALARVLPLTDRVEVRLLGSGLPSIWIAHMGDMRLVLALSGWTTNDWTSGSGLDLLAGTTEPDARTMLQADRFLQNEQRATLPAIAAATGASEESLVPALHLLAKRGQLIFDHADQVYRYRQVMPAVLSEAFLGPEHPELVEGRAMARSNAVTIDRDELLSDGRRAVVGKAKGTGCEAIFDEDLAIKKAKCSCSYFYKSGLRAGPCRHLLALKMVLSSRALPQAPKPEPAPEAPKASKWSSGESFPIPRQILDDIRKVANRKNTTVSRVLEEAWDVAMPRIQAERSWTTALALADVTLARSLATRVPADAVEERLALPPDVLAEVKRVADRFRAERASVLCLAWLLGRKSL